MEVGRAILDAAQCKSFNGTIGWLVDKTIDLEIVHFVVEIEWWYVARRTVSFAPEYRLAKTRFESPFF